MQKGLSGQNMTDEDDVNRTKTGPVARRSLSKDHRLYWEARLYKKRWRDNAGRFCESPHWYVRIHFGGRETRLCTGISNKTVAAGIVRDLYLESRRIGWEEALGMFRRGEGRKNDRSRKLTVGDFLEAARSVSTARPETFNEYARCLRQVAGQINGVISGKEKFSRRDGRSKKVRERLNGIRLDSLTPEGVERWKRRYLGKAAGDPVKLARTRTSLNTIIRQCRALFCRHVLKHLDLELPQTTLDAFSEIDYERSPDTRYRGLGKTSPELLLIAAERELCDQKPELYTVFLLALLAGLRRREIDTLTWQQVDLINRQIRIEPNQYYQPKSERSCGNVPLEEPLGELLRSLMARANGEFVVASYVQPQPSKRYRCDPLFRELTAWLREKGVASTKPLHQLRKEHGSLINARHGIHAASVALRHSHITTTANYYTDSRLKATTGLGEVLNAGAKALKRSG